MNQYTEIYEVPTDIEVNDSMGFTWSYRDGLWGFTSPAKGSQWVASVSARLGAPTAWMGPFAEAK